MSRAVSPFSSFAGGLFTESSPVTPPANTCYDMSNFDLYPDGSQRKRFGFAAEDNFLACPASKFPASIVESSGICSLNWNNPGGDITVNLQIVQIGNLLYFHNKSAPGALSRNALSTIIDMTPFAKDTLSDPGKFQISGASLLGYFYITSPNLNMFYLSFDRVTQVITATGGTCKIRDTAGLDDGLKNDEQPSNLTDIHKYNLFNQGWNQPQIDAYYAKYKKYPANSQIWWESKDASGNFDVDNMANIQFGTTAPPKGRYILDLYRQDRSTVSGVPDLPVVTITDRPQGIAAWKGRIFIGINGVFYFSQVVQKPSDAFLFYQAADPTSETDSILVDSDGGYDQINNCQNIVAIRSTEVSLIICSSSGIFGVSGFSGYEFSATSYRNFFITNVKVQRENSVCVAEGDVYVVSESGLYRLYTTDRGNIDPENITKLTIETIYLSISAASKAGATVFYDANSKIVTIMYDFNADSNQSKFQNQYDRFLCYNTVTKAFFKYEIASPVLKTAFIADFVELNSNVTAVESEPVYIGTEPVLIGSEAVVIDIPVQLIEESSVAFLSVYGDDTNGYNYTFVEPIGSNFLDYEFVDGVGAEFDAYIKSQYMTAGDLSRRKGCIYAFLIFNRTEQYWVDIGDGVPGYDNPSGCTLQAIWDFASQDFGTFLTNNKQKAYRLSTFVPGEIGEPIKYPYDKIKTKLMLRGRGTSLQLLLEADRGKNCEYWGHSLEWTTKDTPM